MTDPHNKAAKEAGAIEDAKRIGWVRHELHGYIAWEGTPGVWLAHYNNNLGQWFVGPWSLPHKTALSEAAALSAAIDATPNARRLLAVMAENEALKADVLHAREREQTAVTQRNALRSRLAAFEALSPKVEAVRVARERKPKIERAWREATHPDAQEELHDEHKAVTKTIAKAESALCTEILPLFQAVAPKETT